MLVSADVLVGSYFPRVQVLSLPTYLPIATSSSLCLPLVVIGIETETVKCILKSQLTFFGDRGRLRIQFDQLLDRQIDRG